MRSMVVRENPNKMLNGFLIFIQIITKEHILSRKIIIFENIKRCYVNRISDK